MKKLFKKLNEQIKTSSIKNKPITEEEFSSIETKVIYENFVENTKLDIESSME